MKAESGSYYQSLDCTHNQKLAWLKFLVGSIKAIEVYKAIQLIRMSYKKENNHLTTSAFFHLEFKLQISLPSSATSLHHPLKTGLERSPEGEGTALTLVTHPVLLAKD